MSRFWSDLIQDLSPYVPGEQPKSANLIKLNTNENPYGPSPLAMSVLLEDIGPDLRRYPDPYSISLRTAVAARYGLSPEYAFAGNGSDEVLGLAFATFLRRGLGSRGHFNIRMCRTASIRYGRVSSKSKLRRFRYLPI